MEELSSYQVLKVGGASKVKEKRVPTGIEEFDDFVEGGFPRGSMILLAGAAGSGKTIFASQYVYHGMSKLNESGVYVSFAENRSAFMKNMKRMGMDFEKYEQKGKFKFLDLITVRDKGVESIVKRVLAEVDSLGAKRLVIDSFSALVQAFSETIDARIMLHTVLGKIAYLNGVTTLLISERPFGTEYSGRGMEEFVTDGVIALNSITRNGWLNRTLQVLKLRGTRINSEEHSYSIDEHGIGTHPLPTIRPVKKIYSERVHTGIEALDEMFSDGVYKGSATLVGGASGTGKTTLALHFIAEEAKHNGKGLYISLEEPAQQLIRHGESFGWSMSEFVDKGLIEFVNYSPETYNVEQQLGEIFNLLKEYKPVRFVIDSIAALERVMLEDRYLRYLKSLVSHLKDQGTTTLLTVLTESVTSITGTGISPAVDNIITLKNVEIEGTLRRSLGILKSRGSAHGSEIREFEITPKGAVLKKFVGMEHVFEGKPRKSMQEKPSADRSRP